MSAIIFCKHEVNMAAERIVMLKENEIKCHIDQYLINIELNNAGKKIGRKKYGGKKTGKYRLTK